MMIGSIIVMAEHGVNPGPVFDFKNQINHLPDVFGNTIFAFIFHFAISGIVYPMRPQKKIVTMFAYSNIVGGGLLAIESILAWMAFGGNNLKTSCPSNFP
jgi:hypothetical protein